MPRAILAEPGQDPLTLHANAVAKRGWGGLSFDASWVFIGVCAVAFAGYLFWQFGPKAAAVAAEPTPSRTPEWQSPTPTGTSTATPTLGPTMTRLPTGILSGQASTQYPQKMQRNMSIS